MNLIRLIILSLFIFTHTQADTIYNLIKIPNLEIYDIKTPNKLRYLYAKQPFTLGVNNNISCYNSQKKVLDQKYKIIKKNLNRYDQNFLKKINLRNFRLTFRSKYRAADIEPKKNSIVPGGLFEISKSDEKKLDVYEDFPVLYKKYYFFYYGKKVMTYTMVKKTPFRFPTERYLNIVKQGYKDCKINIKSLQAALLPVEHLQR